MLHSVPKVIPAALQTQRGRPGTLPPRHSPAAPALGTQLDLTALQNANQSVGTGHSGRIMVVFTCQYSRKF